MIQLGHTMHLEVVAECVESHERDERGLHEAIRANDDETNTCLEFTLGGIGQTSSGYAPNQRQPKFEASIRIALATSFARVRAPLSTESRA
jgi:hypothetical protein